MTTPSKETVDRMAGPDFTVGRFAVAEGYSGKLYPLVRKIDVVTPKMIKTAYTNFSGHMQTPKEQVMVTFATEAEAERLAEAIHAIRRERDRVIAEASEAASVALNQTLAAYRAGKEARS